MVPRPGPAPTLLYSLIFGFALFVNSAVLWLTEPILAKFMLPLWSGSAQGWVGALLFAQGMLLAGCGYAHLLTCLLRPRLQILVHLTMAGLPLFWAALRPGGLIPSDDWNRRVPAANPLAQFLTVFVLLLLLGGAVYFILTASVPLLQRWFAATGHPDSTDPYFLYGVGGLGGLATVLGYPLLIEPHLDLRTQGAMWAYGYALAAALSLLAGLLVWFSPAAFRPHEPAADRPERGEPSPSGTVVPLRRRLRWVALAAMPASLVTAQTTYITTDISAIPLFWMVPLMLFLCARVLAFTRQPLLSLLSRRGLLALRFAHGMAILLPLVALFLLQRPAGQPPSPWTAPLLTVLAPLILLMPHSWVLVAQPVLTVALFLGMFAPLPVFSGLPLHVVVLYVCVRLCYGELARDRPPVAHLTGYFLWIAIGNALGALFNALLAPLLFPTSVPEYQLALVLVCMLRPAGLGKRLTDGLVVRVATALPGCGTSERLAHPLATVALGSVWLLLLGLFAAQVAIRVPQPAPLNQRDWFDGPPVVRPPASPETAISYAWPVLLCFLMAGRPVWFGLSLGIVLLVAPSYAGRTGGNDILGGLPSAAVERVGFTLLLTPLAVAALAVTVGLVSGWVVALSGGGSRCGVDEPDA